MSLVDLGYTNPVCVPENPNLMLAESLDLQDFFNSEVPVGIIPQENLKDCIISSEFGDCETELFSNLGALASGAIVNKDPRKPFVTDGFTEFGHRTYSIMHHRDNLGRSAVKTLIRINFNESAFLFGHGHMLRGRNEQFSGPLNQHDINEFTIIARAPCADAA